MDTIQANRKIINSIVKDYGFKTVRSSYFALRLLLRQITYSKDAGPIVWTWRMLHELGHLELTAEKERTHINTLKRLSKLHLGYKKTPAFYRDFIEAERKAWKRGILIAEREGISINVSKYEKHATSCINEHLEFLKK